MRRPYATRPAAAVAANANTFVVTHVRHAPQQAPTAGVRSLALLSNGSARTLVLSSIRQSYAGSEFAQDAQVRQVPPLLVQVEAVADEQLVGHDEADVAHRQVVDEPAV